MLPAGTYPATAIAADAQFGRTRKGHAQIALPFRIDEGEHAGQAITWFGFFTDKTRERTMESLRYCGWRGDDLSDLGPLDQQVEIVIEHEEYDGKVRAKVQWVNRIGSGRVQLQDQMNESELRQFAAQMRSIARGIPEASGPRSERRSGARAQQQGLGYPDDPGPVGMHGDDDIPF